MTLIGSILNAISMALLVASGYVAFKLNNPLLASFIIFAGAELYAYNRKHYFKY